MVQSSPLQHRWTAAMKEPSCPSFSVYRFIQISIKANPAFVEQGVAEVNSQDVEQVAPASAGCL